MARSYRCALYGSFSFVLMVAFVPAPAFAQPQAGDFYKGKTVELLIGLSAGGGYDAYGRMLARFIGRHLPGQPQIVPRNMPGAGSLVLINHLYSIAPKTGLTFGIFDPVILISPLMGGPNAAFDATRFSWIGSMAGGTSVCAT
jgi:tripartite-type tricarboxylate transporter receptor subunit TctC